MRITGTDLPKTSSGVPITELQQRSGTSLNVKDDASKAVLDTIATNTANIKLSADNVNLNVDGLETLITATNNKLDTFSGNGNNNIGEGSTKLQIYNYGRDVTAGNFKPMVVNSSAEQIVALSSTDNAVLDAIATDGDNIQTKLDALETSLTSMEAKQDTQVTHLSEIEGAVESLEACITANKLQVDIVSGGGGGGGGGDASAANQSTQITHLSEIEGAVETLEACVGSNKVNVNISSGGFDGVVSGTVTANLSATDNAVLDAIATDGDNIQTKLDTIDGSINTLEACVGSNKVNVNISSGGFDGVVSGTVTANLSATDNAVLDAIATDGDNIQTKLDTLETSLTAMEGKQDTQVTHLSEIEGAVETLEACVGSNKVNVNISSGGFDGVVSGTVTANLSATDNAVLDAIATDGDNIQTKLDTIDGSINTLEACVGSNKVNVNISSGGFDGVVSGTVTANLSATDNAVLDAIATDGDNIQTKLDTLESSLTAMEGKQDTQVTHLSEIEGAVETLEACVGSNKIAVSGGGNTARLNISTGGSELIDDELTSSVDCSAFSEICVMYPTTKTNTDLQLFVQGATTSSGTYNTFAVMKRKELKSTTGMGGGGTTVYIWGTGDDQTNAIFIPCLYPHIKILNKTGEAFADSDDIRIVGK